MTAPPLPVSSPPSPFIAWLSLIRISIVRQARMRQMVWVALSLMILSVVFVAMNTQLGSWKLTQRRARPWRMNFQQSLVQLSRLEIALGHSEPASAIHTAVLGSTAAIVEHSAVVVFS